MKKSKQIILFFIITGVLCALIFPVSEDPLTSSVYVVICTSLLTFIFNVITEYSWTDRLWGTLPVFISWIYFIKTGKPVLLVTAVLITIWGARLTFNFSRRGGFNSIEDYRWSYLHKNMGGGLVWQLFSFFFIACYQQGLFIAFTSPLEVVALNGMINIGTVIFSIIAILFLVFETVADQQQWEFQESKYGKRKKQSRFEKEYQQGFRTSGLFRICRHPNYLGELGFWWSVYFLCSSTAGSFINFSLTGPVLLTLLFVGSVSFTERISSGKYPDYSNYKKRVSAVLPLPWKIIGK